MDRQVQRQADRVGEQMAFASVDLLPGVIAAQSARFRSLHTLTVDHTRCRRGLLAVMLSRFHQQDHPDPMPDAVLPETTEIVIHRALGWKLLW